MISKIRRIWKNGVLGKIVVSFVFIALSCCVCVGFGGILSLLGLSPTPTTTPIKTAPTTMSMVAPTTIETVPTLTPTGAPTLTETATPTIEPTPTNANLAALDKYPCIPANTERTEAKVTRIVDGDTIDVVIGGQTYRVRYIGIDTPERDQWYYLESTEANRRLVEDKTVLLVKDVSETDKYGRLLRYVLVDGIFVNLQLVEEGYAVPATYPPDVSCVGAFLAASRKARNAEVGLWQSTPTPAPKPTVKTGQGAGNCDPAYPDVCIPSPPPDLSCKDIPYKRFRVLPPDPHGFDGDKDGIGCER